MKRIFAERDRERFPGAFLKYSGLPANALYEFAPQFARAWDDVDGRPRIVQFDAAARTWKRGRADRMLGAEWAAACFPVIGKDIFIRRTGKQWADGERWSGHGNVDGGE